ncbi:MAG TPA: hypothetical protein VL856_15750 [Acidimicrobiia bacterium]|jgi:hypothetical protein|nr:hypothetical protein [Acidimicrobiia bacterium]
MSASTKPSSGKTTVAAIVATMALLTIAMPVAFAAKRPSGPTSSHIALESYSDLRLGGYVGFTTVAVGLAGWEYPMVSITCSQGGNPVFVDLGQPDHEFLLGGSASTWLTNGGAADCVAELDAYGWKGGKESVRTLDSVPFTAAG